MTIHAKTRKRSLVDELSSVVIGGQQKYTFYFNEGSLAKKRCFEGQEKKL